MICSSKGPAEALSPKGPQKPGAGPAKAAILIVSMSTSIQVPINLVWQIGFPPFVERSFEILDGVILLDCKEGSVFMFYCTIGYLAFLAIINFVVSFFVRNLPDSFNEPKNNHPVCTKSAYFRWHKPTHLMETRFNTDSFKSILALIFAVEEVNENPDLLPNITLGFQMFDSCFLESASLQAVFQTMSSNGNQPPNYKCGSEPIVPAIIGDVSTSSVAIARMLGLWRFPQVSYVAALPTLSNKFEFPSFTRTTVSTRSQPQALIELCKKFEWTWIGVVASSADSYIQGVVEFRKEAIKNGICIEFFEIVTFNPINNRIPKTVDIISRSTARVVILYSTIAEILLLFHKILQENVNGKVWIGTEAWYTIPPIDIQFWTVLNGTIGIARSRNISPNFSSFLQTLNPSKYPRMIFVKTFWEVMFNCRWPEPEVNTHFINLGHVNKTCTGLEKVVTNDVAELNDPTSLFVYMAHNAVYAIAHALHNLLHCSPGEGPFHGGSCANKQDIQPWQLLHYLRRVHFVNTAGEDVSFNANGDIYGHFDIMNWQSEDNGRQFLKVGIFNEYLDQKLSINESAIFWAGGQLPVSVCSDVCPPGYWKMPRRGQPVCCYDCVLCPESMVSNEANSARCFSCPQDFWPNNKRIKCVPKVVEFLSYEEPLGLVLASLSIAFSITTMMVLIVFIRFRNTTVVKANNRNLSYVLLLSLIFCFLCSFVFIGCPVKLTCSVRQSLFGIIFSLCISCILAKTIIVVIAFKATKPGSNLRVWIGSKTAILVVSMSTSVQVLIILVWQIEFTPYLERNYGVLLGVILLECNEGWVVMFYCTIGYLAFLATISFVVAFLARNLPDSFNEAKYITFSMLTFLSVWSTFIPAYLSTKGKYIVAVEIFAIFLSSFGLLCCIFGPKCYIILLRPSMNTKQYLKT
ncbi:extracellular calcium-sensing receptor-like [Dendropsophus ebraccatus]|uniref:extracellular calcium-sensing receptor-like n=1 Tax=Dendropsophus ebraccatus TaxID=150705 RepID=UPI00383232BF